MTFFSVIIPTHNRADLLKKQLAALKNQQLNASDYEVIVAADGCTDQTAEVVGRFQKIMPHLHFLPLKKGNPAKTRNAGAQQAKGRYLCFTDDDCQASTSWLAEMKKAILDSEKDTIAWEGATMTYKKMVSPLTHQIENLKGHVALPTCNAVFEKDAFFSVNGFDESFPFAHNEDADLAWRIRKTGKIAFVKNALMIHPPRPVSFKKAAQRMKILESEFLLYFKDPAAYQAHRNTSPWKTIYAEVALRHIPRHLLFNFKYLRKPRFFMQGIALAVAWWYSLLAYWPSFKKSELKYKTRYQLPTSTQH